eukprot:9469996-Pyramimonas_sp.AAC.1
MYRNGPRPPCEPCHWRLRRSSLWNHDPCKECADMARGSHANPAIGALSGTRPYWATILVRGVPKWPKAAMRTLSLAPLVELPVGPRSS